MEPEDLSTEEVEEIVKSDSRVFVKLPATVGTNFVMDEITSFIRDLEAEAETDVIVFNKNLTEHTRLSGGKKSDLFDRFIYGMHLDLLPYTEVIISVAKSDENALKRVMEKHSIRNSYIVGKT